MMLEGILLFALFGIGFFAIVTWTQPVERIDVPETFPPHPRLFLNQQEIAELKAWAKEEPWLGEYVEGLVRRCLEDVEGGFRPPEGEEPGQVKQAERASDLALAYVLSDDRRLADAAADILRDYVKTYPTYEIATLKGRATTSTLGEATWATSIATAYDLVYNSGALSDADQQAIETQVLRPCGEVLRICNHHYRSNWRSRAMAGLGAVGFCLGDRELIDEALNGCHDESGRLLRDGFAHHLAGAVLADGVFYERTIGYHHAALYNYTWLMEAARHSGVDLWHLEVAGHEGDAGADVERRFGPTGRKTIKILFDLPFYYVFGDTSGAAVANSKDFRLKRVWVYEAAWRQFHDPKYAWIIHRHEKERLESAAELMWICRDLPAGQYDLTEDVPVGLTGRHTRACTLLPNGGYTILRQSADENAVSVLITYGKYGSGHSHPDKLGLVVYAAGRQVIPEVNHYRYQDADFLTWNNQTIGHNTVTVDEIAQHPQGKSDSAWTGDTVDKPVRGRPIFFHPGEQLKAFRADCDSAYDGVHLDRTIALIDSVIIDFFRLRSDQVHQYDYALHLDGQWADCSLPLSDPQAGPLSDALGYHHVVDIRRAATDRQPVELVYTTGDDSPPLRLTFLPPGEGELIVANGHHDLDDRRRSMLIVRRRAARADFVGVIRPTDSLDESMTVRRLDALPDGLLGVEIARADGRKDILISAEQAGTFEVAGQSVTGQLALLRTTPDGGTSVVETAG